MLRHFALSLEHMDGHGGLVIIRGREHLVRLGRDRRVLLDQFGHHATECLDTQRQWRHIQQQHVFDITTQHAALNRCAHRHRFIRVDVTPGFFAKKVFYRILDLRHTSLAADQKDIVDLRSGKARILERRLARVNRPADQVIHQRLKLGARQLKVEVLRSTLVCCDVGQVDFGLRAGGQFNLGFFCPSFRRCMASASPRRSMP